MQRAQCLHSLHQVAAPSSGFSKDALCLITGFGTPPDFSASQVQVLDVGGRPFRAVHSMPLSRGAHFQLVSKQQEHKP